MPHESTVNHEKGARGPDKALSNGGAHDDKAAPNQQPAQQSASQKNLERSQSLLPHLFAEKPTEVTHHHDTDEEDSDEKSTD